MAAHPITKFFTEVYNVLPDEKSVVDREMLRDAEAFLSAEFVEKMGPLFMQFVDKALNDDTPLSKEVRSTLYTIWGRRRPMQAQRPNPSMISKIATKFNRRWSS